MPDAPLVIPKTPEEFAQLVRDFRERLTTDPVFVEVVEVLCGSAERAQVFAAGGVGISTFAGLLGVPASTVRHYQRLGLITPYEVNGKFRFWWHNLVQAESVRQWRDLGLSLEEIQEQRAQERLGGQTATFNVHTAGKQRWGVLVTGKDVLVTPLRDETAALPFNAFDPQTLGFAVGADRTPVPSRDVFRGAAPAPQGPAGRDWTLDVTRLRDEVRTARVQLEDRLQRLESQLHRARALEAALSEAIGG